MRLFLSSFKKIHSFLFITLFILLSGCASYSDKEIQEFDALIKNYISENNLEMERLENGLYYKIKNEGKGEEYIKFTDKITFIYKGYFLNDELFQEVSEDDPLKFKVSQLIAGWQDALSMVKNKGEIKVIMPPQLGYGKKNTGTIPPNSILVYDLKVLEVN